MSSENWLEPLLRSLAGAPRESELSPQVAQADEMLRRVLLQGDALLASPTFRYMMENAREGGKREEEARTWSERQQLRQEIARLREEVVAANLRALTAEHGAAMAEQRVALADQRCDMWRMMAQFPAQRAEEERVRADAQVKTALIAGSLPIIGELLKDSG